MDSDALNELAKLKRRLVLTEEENRLFRFGNLACEVSQKSHKRCAKCLQFKTIKEFYSKQAYCKACCKRLSVEKYHGEK